MDVVFCRGDCGAWLPADQEPVTIRAADGKWAKVQLCAMCEGRLKDYRRKVVIKRHRQPA